MKKTMVFGALVALAWAGSAFAQTPKTDDEKALYSLGYSIGQDFQMSKSELEVVKKGMADGSSGAKPAVDLQTYGPKIRDIAQARAKAKASAEAPKNKKEGAAYAQKAAKEKGAVVEKNGLVYIPQKVGSGAQPKPTDTVKVNYRGTLIDGTEFDSSYKRNQPAEFPLNAVIPCWTEGLQKMKVGGKAKLVCPSDIAYGDMGRPPSIPPGSTLVFEVELLDITKKG